MKVLSVASECVPFVKTGGLADVVGALPGALAPSGVEMRVLMPGYPAMKAALVRGHRSPGARAPARWGRAPRQPHGPPASTSWFWIRPGCSTGPAIPISAPTARTGPTTICATAPCAAPPRGSPPVGSAAGCRKSCTCTTGRRAWPQSGSSSAAGRRHPAC